MRQSPCDGTGRAVSQAAADMRGLVNGGAATSITASISTKLRTRVGKRVQPRQLCLHGCWRARGGGGRQASSSSVRGSVGTMAPELNRCGRTMLELHVVGSGSGADGTGSYTVRDSRCTELCNAIDPHQHALVACRRPCDDHLAMAPAEQSLRQQRT